MARTLADTASIVAARAHDTSTAFISTVKTFLNEIMFKMLSKSETWEFMEADGNFNTVADDPDYALASEVGATNIRRFLKLRIEAHNHNLKPITIEEYENRYQDPDAETGLPVYYTVWNDKLLLGPAPDAVYTINYRYYKSQPELADGDSPPWPAEYDYIWRAGAQAMAFNYNDDERERGQWAVYFDGLTRMVGDDEVIDEEIVMSPFTTMHDFLIHDRSYPPNRF